MPQAQRSLRLTDSYRDRLDALETRVEARARSEWPAIAELDHTVWPDRVATVVTQAQAEAVRLTAGYLTAFLTTELGRPTRGPQLASETFAGKSRTGQPLAETMRAPIFNVLGALKAGDDPEAALEVGWQKARLLIELDLMSAARDSLQSGLEADERFTGWQRAVRGTCGACMGASDDGGGEPGEPMHIHPNCKCVAEPTVAGSRVVSTGDLPKEKADAAAKAGQLCEAVHKMPRDTPGVYCRLGGNSEEMMAAAEFDPATNTIVMSQWAEDKLLTNVLHELGHKTDLALGRGRNFLTAGEPPSMKGLMDAIRSSPAMERLDKSAFKVRGYHDDPPEMFARAYAQWIAEKQSIFEPFGASEVKHGMQWTAEEFDPIAREFDKFFRARGLLNE